MVDANILTTCEENLGNLVDICDADVVSLANRWNKAFKVAAVPFRESAKYFVEGVRVVENYSKKKFYN